MANDHRIKHSEGDKNITLHMGDMTDSNNINTIIGTVRPTEIYHMAAQSHVQISFDLSIYTADCVAIGTLRMLNAIRTAGLEESCRFYQSASAELFGNATQVPQTEDTPFAPRSPYGIAKQFCYWMGKNYREAYGMHVSSGILYSHESPRRGPAFVTRKITRAVSRIKLGLQDRLTLGNMNAQRDWGHARDYVYAMWLMCQQEQGDDYILATGQMCSVRQFVEICFKYVGISIEWRGEGLDEEGFDPESPERVLVSVNPQFFRPTEVQNMLGDPTKAETQLGWVRESSFADLVNEMMDLDMGLAKKELESSQ